MNEEKITLTIGKQKNIALIAHDSKKKELIAWCEISRLALKLQREELILLFSSQIHQQHSHMIRT